MKFQKKDPETLKFQLFKIELNKKYNKFLKYNKVFQVRLTIYLSSYMLVSTQYTTRRKCKH